MVMMLRQCCCGCSLKTGAIILGVLNILGAFGILITGFATAAGTGPYCAYSTRMLAGVGTVLAVVGVILLLVSISLIIGAENGNSALLHPWMVYTIVVLVGSIFLYIFVAVQLFAMGLAVNGAGLILGSLIYFLLETYCLLVVYSLYRELKGTAPQKHA